MKITFPEITPFNEIDLKKWQIRLEKEGEFVGENKLKPVLDRCETFQTLLQQPIRYPGHHSQTGHSASRHHH